MTRFHVIAGLIMIVVLLSPTGRADHIPQHNDGDPTFPMPLPSQAFFNGGGTIVFLTMIGPADGTPVYNTTYDITYISDGVTPASDIRIHVVVPLQAGAVELVVTGADLGFGSGPGTFHGTLQTDAFNGTVVAGLFDFATIDLVIDAVNGAVQGLGYFEDSFITFDVALPCPADTDMSGGVDVDDLIGVILDFGTNGAVHRSDIDGNGIVDVDDLVAVILDWGECP